MNQKNLISKYVCIKNWKAAHFVPSSLHSIGSPYANETIFELGKCYVVKIEYNIEDLRPIKNCIIYNDKNIAYFIKERILKEHFIDFKSYRNNKIKEILQ